MKRLAMAGVLLPLLWLGACNSSGPVRRVSEPAASIQQLSVRADGSWSVDLRIDNFSSVPMRFDGISLAVSVGDQPAGTLQGQPALSIGPETADVATLALVPAAGAKILIADALAAGHSIGYRLQGSLTAAPQDAGARTFRIERDNTLTPVPGLPGVLR